MFKLKYIENQQLKCLTDKLEDNSNVCRQILDILNNKVTKIVLDKNIKNSYYVFLNDTIYLSDKEKNKTKYQRICLIAHECIHSVQNKVLQVINFILSNIELLMFVISLICMICKFKVDIVLYIYLFINIVSFIPRLFLEVDATIKSINLSNEYIKDKLKENEVKILMNSYKKQVYIFLPLFIMLLMLGRIFRILIIYLLNFNIK